MAVYSPPPFSVTVLNKILERIVPHFPANLLLMGDFNTILSPELGRPRLPKQYSVELQNWVEEAGVIEVWRWRNSDKRVYTCFSTPYKTSSRIDFANSAM